MFRAQAFLGTALSGLLVAQATLAGQGRVTSSVPAPTQQTFSATNSGFLASLERIARGSALWREDLAAVNRTGRRVVLVSTAQVLFTNARADVRERFDQSALAEIALPAIDGPNVDVVFVVVNLDLIEQAHAARNSLPAERDADLDRVLVHEIYGHAFPYLLAGNISGRCADPVEGERAVDACSIRRENAVRAELGLGRRTDYGVGGLSLSRAGSAELPSIVRAGNVPRSAR